MNPLLRVYKAKIKAVYQVKKDSNKTEQISKTLWEMGQASTTLQLGYDIGCLHAYLHVLFTLVFLSCFVICYGDYVVYCLVVIF